MPGPKYHLKLYGHASKDEGLFVKQFAAVLEIEETAVRNLLGQVPVVLREGLDKEKAEELQGICSSFGTLCLIEPMDGDETEYASAEAATKTSLLSGLKMPVPRAYVWYWLLPALIAIFVLFVSVTFFSSLRHLHRKNQQPTEAAVGRGVGTASDSAVPASNDATDTPLEVLDKIEELNSRIVGKRFWLEEAERSMYRLQMTNNPDKRDLDELRQRIYGLQTEIGASIKELQFLKKGLAEVEIKKQD